MTEERKWKDVLQEIIDDPKIKTSIEEKGFFLNELRHNAYYLNTVVSSRTHNHICGVTNRGN